MNTFPELWRRVPIGATIPANTPYAYTYANTLAFELNGYPYDIAVNRVSYPHYTEHRITTPLDKCPACRDDRRPCECGLL